MKRVDGWRTRFEAAVDALKHRPFQWGEHDCGPGLAGAIVLAITGVDCAEGYRGTYDSAASAVRVMKAHGFSNLGDLVADMLPEIHPSMAKIGDIVAIADDTPFGFALGVVNGERVFVLRESGMGTVDLLTASRAFKVG